MVLVHLLVIDIDLRRFYPIGPTCIFLLSKTLLFRYQLILSAHREHLVITVTNINAIEFD